MPGRGRTKGSKDETNTNPEQKRKRGPSSSNSVAEEMPAKTTKVSKDKDKLKDTSRSRKIDDNLSLAKSPKGDKRKFIVQSLDVPDRRSVSESITNDSDGESSVNNNAMPCDHDAQVDDDYIDVEAEYDQDHFNTDDEFDNKSETSHVMEESARSVADRIILEAKQFCTNLVAPKGNEQFYFNRHNKPSEFVGVVNE